MGGPGGCQLSADQLAMDQALAAIYDETTGEEQQRSRQRSAGLGPSAPSLAKWLGDIRTYFKSDVVTVIQNDAIERKGLTQLLFEPEMLKNVEPNPQLVGTLMSLKGRIPERTKETARMVVRAVLPGRPGRERRRIRPHAVQILDRGASLLGQRLRTGLRVRGGGIRRAARVSRSAGGFACTTLIATARRPLLRTLANCTT